MTPEACDVLEQRLPIHARWSLAALGAVEGRRILKPRDPVAAWLLRHHPGLLPSVPSQAVLSAIRARTAVVDRLLEEAGDRVRRQNVRVALWTFGAGFDARWARMYASLSDVVSEFREVEEPDVSAFKDALFRGSPYEGRWAAVRRVASEIESWAVPSTGTKSLVVLEGLVARHGPEALRQLLLRLRADSADHQVIVEVPTGQGMRAQWSARRLAMLGWRVEEDIDHAPREQLHAWNGHEICAGARAFRVLRLTTREPLQEAP